MRGEARPEYAILNADDKYFATWSAFAEDLKILSFGLSDTADVRAEGICAEPTQTQFQLILPDAKTDVSLPLVGIHNVRNACAAAAVATALGVSAENIALALQSMRPIGGRLQALDGLHGATLYDDTYNANPVSVLAAAEFVAALDGENWLVLGDMGELGADAPQLHEEVGRAVKSVGVDRLFATGNLSKNTVTGFGANASWYDSVHDLSRAVAQSMGPDSNVCVKGSRFMQMERVVAELTAPSSMRREA